MKEIKPRSGKECKKEKCKYYHDYNTWNPQSLTLKFCMNCKHSFRSQYKNKVDK